MSYLFIRSSSEYVFYFCFNFLKIDKRTNYSVLLNFVTRSFVVTWLIINLI